MFKPRSKSSRHNEAVCKLARSCSKKTLFRLKGDPVGDFRTLNGPPYSPAAKAFILGKYGDQVECIANENIEEAVEFVLIADNRFSDN